MDEYIMSRLDLEKEVFIKLKELIVEQYYKSSIQMGDLGFRLDKMGYKTIERYNKAKKSLKCIKVSMINMKRKLIS